jgi:hypothetical protein
VSDLLRAIAFAFQRKGARTMPRMDLHMLLSMDLRWFAPEESKKVVARALDAGLLIAEGDALRIAFEPGGVEVPLSFRPQAKSLLEEPLPESLPTAPAASAAVPAHAARPAPRPAPMPRDDEAHAERAKRGGLLSLEVAQLVVARRGGEDVAPRLAAAEASLLKA